MQQLISSRWCRRCDELVQGPAAGPAGAGAWYSLGCNLFPSAHLPPSTFDFLSSDVWRKTFGRIVALVRKKGATQQRGLSGTAAPPVATS
eukprot:scaffold43499_cov72-Phaeocystis_antarctica.AAC.1